MKKSVADLLASHFQVPERGRSRHSNAYIVKYQKVYIAEDGVNVYARLARRQLAGCQIDGHCAEDRSYAMAIAQTIFIREGRRMENANRRSPAAR
jgi:hypothetical protein